LKLQFSSEEGKKREGKIILIVLGAGGEAT